MVDRIPTALLNSPCYQLQLIKILYSAHCFVLQKRYLYYSMVIESRPTLLLRIPVSVEWAEEMDNLLTPIAHRPSLSYPLNAPNSDVETASYHDRSRYFQQVSSWGNTAYNGFARRKPGPWMTKLFRPRKQDISTLCTGSCLPCVLYGKTQYRLKQMAEGEDPLDLSRQDICNGPCWMFGMIMCCVGFDCE